MGKITTLKEAIRICSDLRAVREKIVLAGGCFDILHIGHLIFLETAKKQGDVLIILLESDEQITKLKGPNRPLNIQSDRARLLSSLIPVDYVIPLNPDMKDKDYEKIVTDIKPDFIAITTGDPHKKQKELQAKKINGSVIEVTPAINDKSTSRLIGLLGKDL